MKKLLGAVLLAALLPGCGAGHLLGATSATSASLAAQSKAVVSKGIHSMFLAAFVTADTNHDGLLESAELPATLPMPTIAGQPTPVTGLEPAAMQAARLALFAALDLNKDGVITFREFARTDAEAAATDFFRGQVGKIYAGLDKNGDRELTPDEVAGSVYKFADLDLNGSGKVTSSEFEDAFIKLQGAGPDPVPAPVPAPVVPDAPATAAAG